MVLYVPKGAAKHHKEVPIHSNDHKVKSNFLIKPHS